MVIEVMRAERVECWDGKTQMAWVFDDGGRAAADFKGLAGDCVTRSIAIATERPYLQVYNALNSLSIVYNTRVAAGRRRKPSSARTGVATAIFRAYLSTIGWTWHPTMAIGSGAQVHLCEEELPAGRLIVRVSKHVTAVIDHEIHDTHDPQRADIEMIDGVRRIVRRCVYGYFTAPGK
jgi:hypothetical protein